MSQDLVCQESSPALRRRWLAHTSFPTLPGRKCARRSCPWRRGASCAPCWTCLVAWSYTLGWVTRGGGAGAGRLRFAPYWPYALWPGVCLRPVSSDLKAAPSPSSFTQMFIPSIMSQGSQEQQDKWLPLCFNLRIIGTYAQVCVQETQGGGGGTSDGCCLSPCLLEPEGGSQDVPAYTKGDQHAC